MMSAPAIEVKGLTKAFGPRVVVNHVNITVPRGKFMVFWGRTAAEKQRRSECCAGC